MATDQPTDEEMLEMLQDLEFQQCSHCEWARCPCCGAEAPRVRYKYGNAESAEHSAECTLKAAIDAWREKLEAEASDGH